MITQSKDHLAHVGESYFHHQKFAFLFGLRCMKAGFMAMMHGLCPALFETAASDEVKCLYALCTKRGPCDEAETKGA